MALLAVAAAVFLQANRTPGCCGSFRALFLRCVQHRLHFHCLKKNILKISTEARTREQSRREGSGIINTVASRDKNIPLDLVSSSTTFLSMHLVSWRQHILIVLYMDISGSPKECTFTLHNSQNSLHMLLQLALIFNMLREATRIAFIFALFRAPCL